jgi:hypothetical protein
MVIFLLDLGIAFWGREDGGACLDDAKDRIYIEITLPAFDAFSLDVAVIFDPIDKCACVRDG